MNLSEGSYRPADRGTTFPKCVQKKRDDKDNRRLKEYIILSATFILFFFIIIYSCVRISTYSLGISQALFIQRTCKQNKNFFKLYMKCLENNLLQYMAVWFKSISFLTNTKQHSKIHNANRIWEDMEYRLRAIQLIHWIVAL